MVNNKLAIIIPAFSGHEQIRHCLESLYDSRYIPESRLSGRRTSAPLHKNRNHVCRISIHATLIPVDFTGRPS